MLNKVFVQNNIHPIFANILIDAEHLSENQIEKILNIERIDLVNFKLVATHNKKDDELPEGIEKKLYPILR